MQLLQRPLILASQSPRRRQLLAEAGYTFEVRPTYADESYPAEMPKAEVAVFLAQKKARAAADQWLGKQPDAIILAADSVVILDGVIYEKPVDEADARRILGALSGRRHTVVTGVCLKDARRELCFSGTSHVHFAPLSAEEIDFYIQKYQPYDKAGAYAVQEWIGLCKIQKIEGTYANVMGLPVDLVYEALASF